MFTKLDVVNDQLATMGEAPITVDLLSSHPYAAIGLRRLAVANRRFQVRGWWFNQIRTDLTPDEDGLVEFPCGILRMEGPGSEGLVIRGNTLYDVRDGSTRLKTVRGALVVVELDFLDLPPMAQIHVRDRAVYDFQQDYDSTESRRAQTQADAAASFIECSAEHIRAVRANRLLMPSTLSKILAASGRTRVGLPVRS